MKVIYSKTIQVPPEHILIVETDSEMNLPKPSVGKTAIPANLQVMEKFTHHPLPCQFETTGSEGGNLQV